MNLNENWVIPRELTSKEWTQLLILLKSCGYKIYYEMDTLVYPILKNNISYPYIGMHVPTFNEITAWSILPSRVTVPHTTYQEVIDELKNKLNELEREIVEDRQAIIPSGEGGLVSDF